MARLRVSSARGEDSPLGIGTARVDSFEDEATAWVASNNIKTFEFIKDRLYYITLDKRVPQELQAQFFDIDQDLIYWNFFLDFGPLNLSQLYRFCQRLNRKLEDPALKNKCIFYTSSGHPYRLANAACLICSWKIIYRGAAPDDAYYPFQRQIFKPFHDATPGHCSYKLTIPDCLRGLHKAWKLGFFDFDDFDADEYEFYEQVENGDLNWLQKGRFLAFAGPHERNQVTSDGGHTLTVENYVPYFLERGVDLVVRLNNKQYDENKFIREGIRHLELYYLDGSNPPLDILQKFIRDSEATQGGIAVHCKAGLGRTGTCIGCYFMKHYRFTAPEVIGWIRICRPGSIIGPQQQFMVRMEEQMWREGKLYREAKERERAAAEAKMTSCEGKGGERGDDHDDDDDGRLAGAAADNKEDPFDVIAPKTPPRGKNNSGSSSNNRMARVSRHMDALSIGSEDEEQEDAKMTAAEREDHSRECESKTQGDNLVAARAANSPVNRKKHDTSTSSSWTRDAHDRLTRKNS